MISDVAEHYFFIGSYSLSWVFLGKSFGNNYKILFKIPFTSDKYIVKHYFGGT